MSLCLSVLLINGISQSFNLISIGKYVLFRFIIITDIGIIFVSFFLSFFFFFFLLFPVFLYAFPTPYFYIKFHLISFVGLKVTFLFFL